MLPDDKASLSDLAKACDLLFEFMGGADRESFLADTKTQAAVLHELMILGEATKRLSSEFRDQNPVVPWREVAGLRDRLIHAYDRVDLEMVWLVLQKRLPALRDFLQQKCDEI